MNRSRRPHPIPLIAGIAVAVVTLQLGNWQTRRAAEKEAVQAAFVAAATSVPRTLGDGLPAEWGSVELEGEWFAPGTILLDNRVHLGRAGYHVLTPLMLAGGRGWVLVNRGWIAAPADRRQLPALTTPAGPVAVAGRVRYASAKPFTLAKAGAVSTGPVWQTLDLARYRAWRKAEIAEFYVQQTSATADGLVRDWPAPAAGVARHRGYAFQWYALAALALVLTVRYLWLTFRSMSLERRNDR